MIAPKQAKPSLPLIDEYCENYKSLFSEVRTYEAFKNIHVGILSDINRKPLPEIAKVLGLENSQGLHYFLTRSPWDVQQVRQSRIQVILKHLKHRRIRLIIDETGDPKKGKKTDYVARQYIGRLGKVENGIVSVVAYGLIDGITFPLLFEVFKPQKCLKPGDTYKTKPQIAAGLVEEIVRLGFQIELVLADSLYGESEGYFLSKLEELGLLYMVSIRSNQGVWLPEGQSVSANEWKTFTRHMSQGETETRYVREVIFGEKGKRTCGDLTTDTKTLPENSTSFVMSNIPNLNYENVGDIYGDRTWVEYGFMQSKSELGWADWRLTHYTDIEKWWELVCSAYLLVTLMTSPFKSSATSSETPTSEIFRSSVTQHPHWNHQTSWKNTLNNLQLLLLPRLCFNPHSAG
ncbi:IS701 family transposase [Laspinema sp. C5]|nr:IS701 family transposase [Laspinema sp. D3c]MCT7997335.1 IS701 family transposase [Laspinema sp. D3c]